MKQLVISLLVTLLAYPTCISVASTSVPESSVTGRPNIVIIYVDDMGYGDVGAFGNDDIDTPRLDQMANEGIRFTAFYNSASGCTPSRAALLTGRYHMRIPVNFIDAPSSKRGMPTREVTIAEVLKDAGYTTAAFGKWHLGTRPPFLPKAQGFDYFYGSTAAHTYYLPYTNYNPSDDLLAPVFESTPDIETKKVGMLATRDRQRVLTDKAIQFIEQQVQAKDPKPFFVYLPYPMPHTPIAVPKELRGKARSKRGLYADVMLSIDQSVGRVLSALQTAGVDENTLVVFASDNGPWDVYGNHSGSALPLRGGKSTEFDGGVRTPCIMWWPGTIRAGQTCDTPAATVDVLPTIVALVDQARRPERIAGDARVIDGHDIRSLFLQGIDVPDDATQRVIPFYDIADRKLHAIRVGRWKMIFPHRNHVVVKMGNDGRIGKYGLKAYPLALYDMENDICESTDVQSDHREVAARLQKLANDVRRDIGGK